MLGIDQEHHKRIRTRDAEASQVHRTGCDPQSLKFEHRVEHRDTGPDGGQGNHRTRRARVHVLEQPVEGQRKENPDRCLDEVGNDADAHQFGVREQIPNRVRRITGYVHLRIDKGLGKAAKDAHNQV